MSEEAPPTTNNTPAEGEGGEKKLSKNELKRLKKMQYQAEQKAKKAAERVGFFFVMERECLDHF